MKTVRNFLSNRPWIWVVVVFVVLIIQWYNLIRIAIENRPESVPLTTSVVHDAP